MQSIHCRANSRRPRHTLSATLASLMTILLASCSQGPARVNQPYIDADGAGAAAMDQYDTNGDGLVAGDELEKAPGLKALLATADTNKDGGITAEEVAERIGIWQRTRKGVMTIRYTVTLNGQPVEGATVTFEPEAFLGDEIKAASGETVYLGGGSATIAKEQRADPKNSPSGMHLGIYEVKISKMVNGKETIPPKYNEHSILGQEVSPDVREILNNRVVYALSTK